MSKRTLAPLLFSLHVALTGPLVAAPALERLSSLDGLSHDAVHAITQDSRGFLWLGTEDGLNRYDGGQFVVHRHDAGDPTTLGSSSITALHEQRGALLWVGTDAGLFRLRDDRESFAPEDLGGRPHVFDLLEGDDGALWIATETGLYRRDLAARQVPLTGSDPAPRTTALEMDAVGNIWALTREGDGYAVLHRLAPDGSSSRAFPLEAHRSAFLVSASGEMWFDLEGPIDDRDSPLMPLQAERLPTAFVAGHDGRMWVGTSHGLYVNDGTEPSLRSLGGDEPADEVLTAYRDRTDRLWFGTRRGLLYGGQSGEPRQLPPPVLTGLSVFDDTGQQPVDQPLLVKELKLTADARAVAFEFVGIEFDRTREVHYRHRLDGFEEPWTDVGKRRFARYTNLPPGNYRFRVQASSDGSFEQASETALGLIVRAPFHSTLWFRGGLLLLVAGAFFAGYRMHVRRLKGAERARLTILGKLHDELDQRLAAIAERAQLDEVQLATGRVRESIRDIEWYVDPDHDTLMSIAARMRSAATAMLAKVQHELRLPDTDRTVAVGMTQRRQIFLIYVELLRNIVDHAEAGRVVVDLQAADGMLLLEVSDDGSGFDPAVESGGGLEEIRHRAAQAGADLTIQSAPGGGTRVRLELPLS